MLNPFGKSNTIWKIALAALILESLAFAILQGLQLDVEPLNGGGSGWPTELGKAAVVIHFPGLILLSRLNLGPLIPLMLFLVGFIDICLSLTMVLLLARLVYSPTRRLT